jgi:ERCC4-type nuclease
MPIKYILDTREKGLQEIFFQNSTPYEIRQLDLGDILILYSKGEIISPADENSNEFKLLKQEVKEQEHPIYSLIIERKSYKDLKSSLADHRYREQKSRYLKLPRRSVYYILENNDPQFKELGKKQFIGAYIHTMIRDGLGVFLTNSMMDTYEYIIKIGETLENFGFPEDLLNSDTNTPSLNSDEKSSYNSESTIDYTQIKKKKAKGCEVYKQQLCCIPGISSGKADCIIKEYPDIMSLIQSLQNNIFKVKGVGKVLIENIKKSLFFNVSS